MPDTECAVCCKRDGLVACWLCGALVCASAAEGETELGFSIGGHLARHVDRVHRKRPSLRKLALAQGGRP